MITSSSIDASGTGRRSLAIFTRLTAIFVGLANLAVLTVLSTNGDPSAWRNVAWTKALPVVIGVVAAGLVASEIILRTFGSSILDERFYIRYAIAVSAVGVGGALMSGLLTAVFTTGAVLGLGSLTGFEQILGVLISCSIAVVIGLAIGLAEGLVFAFLLAAILGLFRT